MAITAITMTANATSEAAISERRGGQLRNWATSLSGIDSSVERATTAEDEVGPCDAGDGAPGKVVAHDGNAGGSHAAGGVALAREASAAGSFGSSTEIGVPTEVSVFRRCEAGMTSPVPIRVVNADLCVGFGPD